MSTKQSAKKTVPALVARLGLVLPVLSMLGCYPAPVVDAGTPWVSAVPGLQAMLWTSDANTLLYVDANARLSAIEVGSHSPRVLREGVGSVQLASSAEGDVIFFDQVAGTSAQGEVELELLRAPLLGAALGPAVVVSELSPFGLHLVSANGATVAIPQRDGVLLLDVASGSARSVPLTTPVAFAPDGTSILGTVGSDYFISNATGGVESISLPPATHVQAVTRWAGETPTQLIVDYAMELDVSSGEQQALLPGIETAATSLASLSGDPVRPDAAYVWQQECLHYTTVGQPPEQVCGAKQATLHRVLLEGGAHSEVAKAEESRPLAVSRDGRRLALYDNGWTGSEPRIDLKLLAAP